MRTIRHTTAKDIPTLLRLADAGRAIMRGTGNMEQWINGYPSIEDFEDDIKQGIGYIIEEDGTPVAMFAFMPSPEPTYLKIYQGQWLNDEPYHVVHRLAALPYSKGIFDTVMEFAEPQTSNIRIDTHRDNVIMRHLLEKHGFIYCGIVYMQNGDERVAYQKVIKQ